jgi:ketosteroid isomerase-like protein
MPESNVKLLRDAFSRLGDEGYEALMPLVHEDFEMTTRPGIAAEPQTYRGAEGMRRWWESFYEVMDEIRVEPSEYHDVGADRVIVDFVLRATGQTSGLEVEQHSFMMIHVRDGKMRRVEFFFTLDEALAAAG